MELSCLFVKGLISLVVSLCSMAPKKKDIHLIYITSVYDRRKKKRQKWVYLRGTTTLYDLPSYLPLFVNMNSCSRDLVWSAGM